MTDNVITRRSFLTHVSGFALAAGLIPATALQAASQKTWSFGIIPDTQWKPVKEPPFTGVAIHVIDAINKEFIRQKVDLVLAAGDMVDFASPEAFRTRMRHNKSLNDAGIPFYPLRGNHDYKDDNDEKELESLRDYQQIVLQPLSRVNACSSPQLANAKGLTYAFTHQGIKFIMLDTFVLKSTDPECEDKWGIADYLPWLQEQLETKDYEQAIIFAHKNLVGMKHKDNLFSDDDENQNSFPEVQNRFYRLLCESHVPVYFSGHDHMYNHSVVTSPDGRSSVHQVICGSASHKFYEPKPPYLDRQKTINQELNRIGFVIGHVMADRLIVDYHSTEPFGERESNPAWVVRNSFEIPFKS
ncbi:MAG: metallophosphoesterase [Planctomycetia bacterium]|nr:metallophosphoesterase [Planctomycetia bacterium]